MIRKQTIVYLIFLAATGYIITPWFFERMLLFNELLAACGLMALSYKRFRVGNDTVSLCMIGLLTWGMVHIASSVFRMDRFYYYLRNTVIIYSMLSFFIGYYFLDYLPGYIGHIRAFLRSYIGIFLFIPLPRYLFERFGMAMLFPGLFKKAASAWVPLLLLCINIIYGFTYSSLTAIMLAAFYLLLFTARGFRFFAGVMTGLLIGFTIVFIYLQPNLSLIANRFDINTYNGIYDVMKSNPLLSLDGNSTWRLVLWKQVLVDHFPGNLFGIGLGTPMMKYYPIEDFSKLASLPYVLGAHNSFIYLFGRLGIIYVVLTMVMYTDIFKEYFRHKLYYYANNGILLFWSFFAITVIALFNPALESPIYASAYWMLLGFTARLIYNRKKEYKQRFEDSIYT